MLDHDTALTELHERHTRADASRLAAGVPRPSLRHALAGRLHRLADHIDDCKDSLTTQVRSASRPHGASTP